jgi:hypothetical protein
MENNFINLKIYVPKKFLIGIISESILNISSNISSNISLNISNSYFNQYKNKTKSFDEIMKEIPYHSER